MKGKRWNFKHRTLIYYIYFYNGCGDYTDIYKIVKKQDRKKNKVYLYSVIGYQPKWRKGI